MAAKKTPTKPHLSNAEAGEARGLYVFRRWSLREIAQARGFDLGALEHASKADCWLKQRDRLMLDREAQAVAEKAHKDDLEAQRTFLDTTRSMVLVRAEAQLEIARKLAAEACAATSCEVPKGYKTDTQAVASALGPASQDVTSGRLAVGLTTEKTETATNIDAYAAVLLTSLDAVAPETKDDDPGGTATPAAPGVAGVQPPVAVPDDRRPTPPRTGTDPR